MRVERSRVSLFVSLGLVAGALAAPLAYASSAAAAEVMSVKNESANFRDGPGDKHAIVYSADKFYPVEVVEKKDAWVKVKDFEGDVAWVAERLLTKQETVVVEGDRVNVREKPNTTSEIAFKAERGEVFKVESHQGKWLKVVDANGDGGWVRDDMVWGEHDGAAVAPKGKTKGEMEDPGAKGAIPPAGDKPLEKAASHKKGDKPEKADKAEEKKADKAEPKPKEGKAAKPAAEEKAKAASDKGDEKKPEKKAEKAEEKKADKAGEAEEKKADDASDDAKGDEAEEKKADDASDDAKKSDAKGEEKADAKGDDDAG